MKMKIKLPQGGGGGGRLPDEKGGDARPLA